MNICYNKKAHHDYEILEKVEAGLVLTGAEIKAIRNHRVNLSGAFARIQGNELWVLNMHIANVKEPERTRKLLVHKNEIKSLIGKTKIKGLSLIPLNLYIKKGKAKLEIALGRGKKIYSKKEDLKKRDAQREMQRELKE